MSKAKASEVIEELRCPFVRMFPVADKAADLIEWQAAEIERLRITVVPEMRELRDHLDDAKCKLKASRQKIDELECEIERLLHHATCPPMTGREMRDYCES